MFRFKRLKVEFTLLTFFFSAGFIVFWIFELDNLIEEAFAAVKKQMELCSYCGEVGYYENESK